MKEAQKKWKGLRDYYRSEFRKTQKERSGQGADTVYKPNWPYFMSLDFLREQFQARPSSGNITLSEHRSEKRKAVQTEITEVSDNNPDSPDNEEDEHNVTDDTLMNDNTPSVATTSANNETQAFTHTNDFRKRTGRQDHIQQLVQLEEKKLSMLQEKKRKQELDKEQKKDDEDFKFFESLSHHLKLITGVNKLMFRNDVQNLVMKYAYGSEYVDSSSRSTPLSSHGSVTGPCTPISIDENSYTLLNIGNMPGAESSVHMWSGNPN